MVAERSDIYMRETGVKQGSSSKAILLSLCLRLELVLLSSGGQSLCLISLGSYYSYFSILLLSLLSSFEAVFIFQSKLSFCGWLSDMSNVIAIVQIHPLPKHAGLYCQNKKFLVQHGCW